MLATIGAIALIGLDAHLVDVECSTASGLPGMRIVGLPDPSVREASERVRTAVQRSRFKWPDTRLVVNLAPADLAKIGSGFDLAFGLAVLAANDALGGASLDGIVAVGELGLDGSCRPVRGILPVARAAARAGARRLFVAEAGAVEASLVGGIEVVPVADLREAAAIVTGEALPRDVPTPPMRLEPPGPDLADVRGQHLARRVLEIAAVGGHHMLFVGPPGCGKTMLAERLPGLLPDLDDEQALEVASIHSIAGLRALDATLTRRPPFRAPHHGASRAGLVGGGSRIAKPGEVSLATHGVLFIDELLEAPRTVLDGLRQPLEAGQITLVRSAGSVTYPARFQLVGASNPCPCGRDGDVRRPCTCRPDVVERYRARMSGPLLDRMDLHLRLRPVDQDDLLGPADGESTATVAARVRSAKAFGHERRRSGLGDPRARNNARADVERLRAALAPGALRQAVHAMDVLGMTARSLGSILRVSRSIADLAGAEQVLLEHVDEALAYRLADLVPA